MWIGLLQGGLHDVFLMFQALLTEGYHFNDTIYKQIKVGTLRMYVSYKHNACMIKSRLMCNT